jgi:hypothetical protein
MRKAILFLIALTFGSPHSAEAYEDKILSYYTCNALHGLGPWHASFEGDQFKHETPGIKPHHDGHIIFLTWNGSCQRADIIPGTNDFFVGPALDRVNSGRTTTLRYLDHAKGKWSATRVGDKWEHSRLLAPPQDPAPVEKCHRCVMARGECSDMNKSRNGESCECDGRPGHIFCFPR